MGKSFRPKVRWRKPLSKHIAKLVDHFDVFIRGKGSCRHFHRFDDGLIKQTIDIQSKLLSFNQMYCNWISKNEIRNPDRFLSEIILKMKAFYYGAANLKLVRVSRYSGEILPSP